MAGRYPYSPYEVDQYPYQESFGAMQSGPKRFFSAVGRFFYRLVVLTLILGAVGGALFALYRNDVLLTLARGAGVEAQYRSLEQSIGAPGWGTPRSIDVPAESAPVAAADDSKPSEAKQPETVQAGATKTSTADGLPIVSFDSLPTAPAKGAATEPAPEAISLSALPAARARTERAEPTRTARAEPSPRVRPAKVKLDEPAKSAEVSRSIPLPKSKPEPVAKAEPEPKPAPPPPKPEPEVDRTAPRANDNPLKAAIRASMAAKKSGE
jgi:hypothetical protein